MGKPSRRLFDTALDRLGEGRTLVVGDRLDSDIAAAEAAGLDGALVLSGGGPSEPRAGGSEAGRGRGRPRGAGRGAVMARRTHHKHSSKKGYRRLLDGLADLDGVHSVATGRVKPRMGSGRPVAQISKVRHTESGLAITINTEGAIVDAYVVTDRPDEVEAAMRERGWTAP